MHYFSPETQGQGVTFSLLTFSQKVAVLHVQDAHRPLVELWLSHSERKHLFAVKAIKDDVGGAVGQHITQLCLSVGGALEGAHPLLLEQLAMGVGCRGGGAGHRPATLQAISYEVRRPDTGGTAALGPLHADDKHAVIIFAI